MGSGVFSYASDACDKSTKRCRGTRRIAASTRSLSASWPSSSLKSSTRISTSSTMCRRKIARCLSFIGFMTQHLRDAKLSGPGGNDRRWRTGDQQNRQVSPPSPGPGRQFPTSDVGHVVVKARAAHPVEVATLQKLVSGGIADYLSSGKRPQERERHTHGVAYQLRDYSNSLAYEPSFKPMGSAAWQSRPFRTSSAPPLPLWL
jgi:hypothetical protein